MSAFMRRSLGLESNELAIVSDDNVGIDVADLFGEVDKVDHHAPNVNNGDTEIEIVCEALDTVGEYVDVLEATGDAGAPPEALQIAEEAISSIFRRYGVQPKAFAAEALTKGRAHATKATIAYAREGMHQIANEGVVDAVKNTLERVKLGVQAAVQRRTVWRNEALKLRRELQRGDHGAPAAGVQYKNTIRIAHMTRGDHTVMTSGKDMLKAVEQTGNAMDGAIDFMEGLAKAFAMFKSGDRSVDFDQIASKFEPSKYASGALSITGSQALFGEEVILTGCEGKAPNKEVAAAIFRNMKINYTHVWNVSDLGDQTLPVLSRDEMLRSVDDLVKAGDILCSISEKFQKEATPFVLKALAGSVVSVPATVLVLLFNNWARLTDEILGAMSRAMDLNGKAVTCMLGYYQFCLKNNDE